MGFATSLSLSSFERLAPELICRVAFFLAVDDEVLEGPPSSVFHLSLVSRTVYNAISLHDNVQFLALLFCEKFDRAAALRRLGHFNSPAFAVELRRRCESLKRIRSGRISPNTLERDLWVAFLMLLENDGLNETILLNWAQLPLFLVEVFKEFNSDAELMFVRETPTFGLAIWLLWLTTYTGEKLT